MLPSEVTAGYGERYQEVGILYGFPTELQVLLSWFPQSLGFPGSSAGKESTCKAGDPGSIPGSRRSAGEGIGYPVQYSSLVAQLVKNPPAMWETWVWSLGSGWEDPLEKG